MDRLLLAIAIVVVATVIAQVVARRRKTDPPTQRRSQMPSQLDRADFDGHGWLVTVFTSDTCSTCADVVRKAEVLRSADVTVQTASFQAHKDLHERYDIDVVPMLLIADAAGVVHNGFIGPVTATDLWAAVAEAREPGSMPSGGCSDHE